MNILHLMYDEKFVDFTADVFDDLPDVVNRYLIIASASSTPYRYVRQRDNMRRVTSEYFRPTRMRGDLEWCDCLIVHYLGIPGARMIVEAPKAVRVMWSAWGGDYQDFLPSGRETLLGDSTQRLVAALPSSSAESTSPGSRLMRVMRVVRRRLVVHRLLRRATARVDYFSAPVEIDFQLVARALGHEFRAEYAQLNYASVERSFTPGTEHELGGDILVGNSASATNNHADVFDLLSQGDLGGREVIVPLSYGDTGYRDAIIAYGRERLGTRLRPLVEYLPLARYNEIVSRCGIAVMGHRRQQGIGNIGTMLQAGARLYLDRRSSVVPCLIERGAIVHTLSDLAGDLSTGLKALSPTQRVTNRSVVASLWSHHVVVQNARRFVDRLRHPPRSPREDDPTPSRWQS